MNFDFILFQKTEFSFISEKEHPKTPLLKEPTSLLFSCRLFDEFLSRIFSRELLD